MQAKFVQEGGSIDYTPGSAVSAGQVVVQNSLVGIAKLDIEANKLGALATRGIFDIVKATGAINAGAALYWDADGDPVGGTSGTGAATTTSTNNSFMGFAQAAALSGDTTARVVFVQVSGVTNTIHEDFTNIIADPGDDGIVGGGSPLPASGHCSIVTAGAEARILPDPTEAGQVLALTLKTDGGDCVVTAENAVNMTGNNTLTFDNAGETIVLIAVDVGATVRWRVVANDGVGLTTV